MQASASSSLIAGTPTAPAALSPLPVAAGLAPDADAAAIAALLVAGPLALEAPAGDARAATLAALTRAARRAELAGVHGLWLVLGDVEVAVHLVPEWSTPGRYLLTAIEPRALVGVSGAAAPRLELRAAAATAASWPAPAAAPEPAGDPVPTLLDSTHAQRTAIGVVLAGGSRLIDAGPAAGKTQTAVNLAAALAASERTCLVVAPPAALRAAHRRLHAAGIGDAALLLPSEAVAGSALVTELGRTLERRFRPATPASAAVVPTELVDGLDARLAALHAPTALGRSVHDVLARLVELRDAPRMTLPEAAEVTCLTAAAFAATRAAVARYAEVRAALGDPAAHPWRTSTLTAWQLGTGDAVRAALDDVLAACRDLTAELAAIARRVPGLRAHTRGQLQRLRELAALAAGSPRPGAEFIAEVARASDEELAAVRTPAPAAKLARRSALGQAIDGPRGPMAYLAMLRRRQAAAHALSLRWNARLWQLDVVDLAARTREALPRGVPARWLALRGVRATLKPAFRGDDLPEDLELARDLELAAEVVATDAALATVTEAASWLGALAAPRATDVNLDAAAAAIDWAMQLRAAYAALELDGDFAAGWRALVAEVAHEPTAVAPAAAALPGVAAVGGSFASLAAALTAFATACERLSRCAGIEFDDADRLSHVATVEAAAQAWHRDAARLRDWVQHRAVRSDAIAAGAEAVVAACERGRLAASDAPLAWERATLLAWVDAALAASDTLAGFWGADEHAQIAALELGERAAQAAVRAGVLAALARGVGTVGGGTVVSDADDAAVSTQHGLADELAAFTALAREVRASGAAPAAVDVLARVPSLLLRARPIVLASPCAAAALLPAAVRFDAVVLDDAHAIDADLGSLAAARADAVLVLADLAHARTVAVSAVDRALTALAPQRWTTSFAHHAAPLATLLDQVAVAADLADPDGAPSRWSGATVVAARRVLEPVAERAALVDAVVADLMAHLGDASRRARSLAVVASDDELATAIEQGLVQALAGRPGFAALLGASAVEPLVVLTLGVDAPVSRDVVLLALDLGPDVGAPRLGALAGGLGAQRFVGAAARARQQLVLATTCDADGVLARAPLGEAGRGLRALAAALAVDVDAVAPVAAPLSPVLAEVATELAARGVGLVPVGAGRGLGAVELAVADVDDPARTILVLEDDGASRLACGGARDRDRLRPAVFAALGVTTHRVWSIDWLADREQELARLLAAVGEAQHAARAHRRASSIAGVNQVAAQEAAAARVAPRPTVPAAPRPVRASGSGRQPVPALLRDAEPTERVAAPRPDDSQRARAPRPQLATGSGSAPSATPSTVLLPSVGRYLAATTPVGRRSADDLFADKHRDEAIRVIERVLAAEAPIHLSLLARRVGAYFGIGRVTARIAEQVRALATPVAAQGDEPDVFWAPTQAPSDWPVVRVAGEAAESRRVIDDVPLAELASAVLVVLQRSGGGVSADVARDAARLLGFSRVTDRVIERIGESIDLLLAREAARRDGARIVRA